MDLFPPFRTNLQVGDSRVEGNVLDVWFNEKRRLNFCRQQRQKKRKRQSATLIKPKTQG